MGKGLLAFLCFFILTTAVNSAEQLTLMLGRTVLTGAEFPFPGQTFAVEYSRMPYSRLQLGLKYANTSALIGKEAHYGAQGFLLTTRLLLETLTKKSPYFGFNFGWLNSSLSEPGLVIYKARGSFCGEAVVGYSLRADEETRINLEYQNRYIELALPAQALQRSETVQLAYVKMFHPFEQRKQTLRSLTPEEGRQNKAQHLQSRFTYNQQQISRYDQLIQKYNQRIFQETDNEKLKTERDFLIQEREKLQDENKELAELLPR